MPLLHELFHVVCPRYHGCMTRPPKNVCPGYAGQQQQQQQQKEGGERQTLKALCRSVALNSQLVPRNMFDKMQRCTPTPCPWKPFGTSNKCSQSLPIRMFSPGILSDCPQRPVHRGRLRERRVCMHCSLVFAAHHAQPETSVVKS